MKTIEGLRNVARETKYLYPYCGYQVQVVMNVETWKLSCDFLPINNYIKYDEGYVTVATYRSPVTMAEIKQDALDALARLNDMDE
jgi:hypothetical protein